MNLEAQLEKYFGFKIHLSMVSELPSLAIFTRQEHFILKKFKSLHRRESWLKGRSALKALLGKFGESQETSSISFPNSRFSITHSGNFAIAAGTREKLVQGLGVDLEISRYPSLNASRYFLKEEERQWILSLSEQEKNEELLRLWTVKEAVLKANTQCKSLLRSYILDNPKSNFGCAFMENTNEIFFKYAVFRFQEGFFAAAVLRTKPLQSCSS